MEVICVQHFQHNPTPDDITKFLESFDPEDSEYSVYGASSQFSSDLGYYFWDPPKLISKTSTQTDSVQQMTSQNDEKDVEVMPPPSPVNANTRTDLDLFDICSSPAQEKQSPHLTKLTIKSHVSSEQRQSKLSILSPKLPVRNSPKPIYTTSPSPKPTSESGCSSRHSPTRIPTRPHIVLTRVLDADEMDYRDVRRDWDSALDGFVSPLPDLFQSSNIHRFRHLGLGIIFRQNN